MKKRDYAGSSQKMAGHEQIAAEVAKNPNGVGYVGLAYLDAKGLKPCTVDGIVGNEANTINKSYPYSRPTFLYTNGDPTGETKKFIDFCLSDEGQQIVRRVHFVPIRLVK
jgi:phosphate transport system substrate-binding protein